MTESSYMIAPGQSAQELDYKRRLAFALMAKGGDAAPVQHWTQGLARMAQGALGGYGLYSAEQADKEETAKGNELLAKMLAGQGAGAQSAPPPAPPSANPVSPPAPSNPKIAAALAQPPASGAPLPQTPESMAVQPSNKVWGYEEGVKAGIYDPPAKPVQTAQAGPPAALPAPAPVPAQTVNGGTAAPGFTPEPGLNRNAMMAALLNNRKTAPMAKGIIQAQIMQQFKPAEYDFKQRDDGSILAIDKKNPRNTQVIPGNAQDLIKFAADKAGATAQAKQNVERSGAIEFESGKAGAIETAKLKAAKDLAKPEQDKQNQKVASIVTQDIDRAIKTIDTSTLPTTGATGNVLASVGGTAAHNLNKLLDTVKSNAGFQELSKMRQASPTGAALGSVTERELALLQSTIGNLEQSQDATQLKDNLRRVKNAYLDIIHGEGKGPPREALTFEENAKAGPSIDDLVKKYSK